MGVILYILLCGFPPFASGSNNQEELFDAILSGRYDFPHPYWSNISCDAMQLISSMLQVNPALRITAKQILQHPWITVSTGVIKHQNLVIVLKLVLLYYFHSILFLKHVWRN